MTGRPPIVLIHGTRLSSAQWSPQLPTLRAEFTVETVDLPGHGARAAEPWDLGRAARVVADAVDRLGPAVVVGHSLGGYVALEFARRYGSGRLRGLVLAGASAPTRGPWTAPYRMIAGLVPRISPERLTRFNDALFRRLYPPEVIGPTIAAGYAFPALSAAWGEVLGRFDASVMREIADRSDAPVLILNGERDRLFRQGERDFARAHGRARIELIPRAGHLANYAAPAAFTDAVRRFAREVGA
ncbi:alpha/beta hydrolase [Streptomyces sp. A7024]|uniref:Alpha/beta hydrolase n=1 Tax=Streptomyces coryli TaxID=1128680 RepID=A0A6G4U729_9ACTN|nr:alpha/beta hydrolase [Streptomyces coryli]NGN67540.1 alpha/beta hydrolase [Streptomyces coryli]